MRTAALFPIGPRRQVAARGWWFAGATACWLAAAANFGHLRAHQPTDAAVDAIFSDFAKPRSPGCALGVYRDGAIVYAKGYGFANLEDEIPITPQTVFDV